MLAPDLERHGLRVVEASVGEGGSAVVHKAEVVEDSDSGLPRSGSFVAVKQYKPSILYIPNQINRITQEGTIGKSIRSPCVVGVYGHSLPGDVDDECFLFMEWIDGETLDVWGRGLRRNAAWEKLKDICENIVEGVTALHAEGIKHRDIKPENVMVVADVAKIMDIGIAEKTGDNSHTLHTTVKDFIGSVRYASPQFVMGEDFEFSDDVYSIGATFLEMLSGRAPYEDVERKPVLPIMVVTAPPEVGTLRENVPNRVKVLVEGCLHRDRNRRPTLDQIREVLRGDSQSAYIEQEVQRRAVDQRSYPIIELDTMGGGFYADVGSDTPHLKQDYTVIRRGDPVLVPSLGTKVAPEMWIATAELRHVHQSIGHFKLTTRRWVNDDKGYRSSISDYFSQSHGHWVETDRKTLDVTVGDFVLKERE